MCPRRAEESRGGRTCLARQASAFLDLLAALHFHTSKAAPEPQSESSDDDAPLPPAAKRRRSARPLGQLAENAEQSPAVWAPVAAQLLLAYGRGLTDDAVITCLLGLARAAPALFSHGGSAEGRTTDPDSTLWALRYAHALATAWPAHLLSSSSDLAFEAEGALESLDRPGPGKLRQGWRAVWRAAMGLVSASGVPSGTVDAALSLLTVIIRRQLAPLPEGAATLWDLPLLGRQPTEAAADFAAAAMEMSSSEAAIGSSWQEALLDWLVGPHVATAPVQGMTQAFLSILHLPGGAGGEAASPAGADAGASGDMPTLSVLLPDAEPHWQWWTGDPKLDMQLAQLMHGESS